MVATDSQADYQADYFQRKTQSADNLCAFAVVRKYMNGAVCVEPAVLDVGRNDLNGLQNGKNENLPIKRISCSCSSERCCAVHAGEKVNKECQIDCSDGSGDFNKKVTQICSVKPSEDDLKLSIASISTATTCFEVSDKQSQDSFKQWLQRKNDEKKRIEENKLYLRELEEHERQKRLKEERENFKRWLTNKKKEEQRLKLEKEKEMEIQKSKEEEKQRHEMECKLRYQLWLKRKEEEELEKKLREQMEMIKIADEKQRRIEENERAYRQWLEQSKNKPKPIPLSRGLDSLRSSVSVTYINPVPWTPNIEDKTKPFSQ